MSDIVINLYYNSIMNRNYFIIYLVFSVKMCFSLDLSIVTIDNYYPYMYKSEGVISGMASDVVRLILDDTQIKYNIKVYPWARSYNIAVNQNNTMIYAAYRTTEREDLFKWIGPIIPPSDMHVYKMRGRSDINIKTIEDIKKYSIGVIRGVKNHEYLIQEGFSDDKIYPANSLVQEIKMFFSKRIDLLVGDYINLAPTLKKLGYSIENLEEVYLLREGEESYMAFHRDIPDDIFTQIEDSFNRNMDNGMISNIQMFYLNLIK